MFSKKSFLNILTSVFWNVLCILFSFLVFHSQAVNVTEDCMIMHRNFFLSKFFHRCGCYFSPTLRFTNCQMLKPSISITGTDWLESTPIKLFTLLLKVERFCVNLQIQNISPVRAVYSSQNFKLTFDCNYIRLVNSLFFKISSEWWFCNASWKKLSFSSFEW